MNINISYNWLREYLPTEKSPEELARLLSLSGPSIERLEHKGSLWEKMVVGQILDIKPHPNADKLKIATTNIGKKNLDIVCGGLNLYKGMKVAVALAGARVRWHGEGDYVELKATEIRGVKSEAMIAAANEIGLFDAFPHKEREVLDLSWCPAPVGASFQSALELEDVIFDTEVTTNRPDLLSMTGFAREAAAITREKLDQKKLDSLEIFPKPQHKETISVKVENKKLCPRYTAVLIKGVKIAPSPWWMRKRLMAAGIRPICNVVDVTNYVMLETGAPLHAFDAKRIAGGIVVRNAKSGERIQALDGNTYKLSPEMLVIADEKKPIAIAGVMGGGETGVNESTTEVILESATFDPVSVRKTSRELNLRSESSLRYEKGLSADLPHRASARAVQLIVENAGAAHGPMVDTRTQKYAPLRFALSVTEAQKLIGAPIAAGEMKRILTNLGFRVQGSGYRFNVTVPYFRDHDIESGRDLVEEIARIYGYHRITGVLPQGEIPKTKKSPELFWEDKIKELMTGAGFNEVITYSFISRSLMDKLDFDSSRALRLWNPLTSDYEFMRTSLLPSALKVIAENQENFPTSKIFELSNVYHPRQRELPVEELNFIAAVTAKKSDSSPFFEVKGLFELLNVRFSLKDFSLKRDLPNANFLHPGRSAVVLWKGKPVGSIGELHPFVLTKFGIEHRVAVLELALGSLLPEFKATGEYRPIPQFPASKRDISFLVPERTSYEKILSAITEADQLIIGAELFDVYSGKNVEAGKKSLAFHIVYQSGERTLTSEEVEAAHNRLGAALAQKFGAEVRS